MNKKITALLCAMMMVLTFCGAAFAENPASTVDVILTAGTAQAFTDEAVPEEDLTKILEAGLAAPSAINQQPWYLAAITNKDVMAEISGSGGALAGGVPDGFEASDGGQAGSDSGSFEGAPEGGLPDGFEASDGGSAGSFFAGGTTGAKAGLGDSPVAIIVYKNVGTSSPNADFDCGLATQNMAIAAASLGYGVKIISSPTGTLNGANHDAICEKLGVDASLQAVAVVLIGHTDESTDAVSGASVRDSLETKTTIVR